MKDINAGRSWGRTAGWCRETCRICEAGWQERRVTGDSDADDLQPVVGGGRGSHDRGRAAVIDSVAAPHHGLPSQEVRRPGKANAWSKIILVRFHLAGVYAKGSKFRARIDDAGLLVGL